MEEQERDGEGDRREREGGGEIGGKCEGECNICDPMGEVLDARGGRSLVNHGRRKNVRSRSHLLPLLSSASCLIPTTSFTDQN